MHVPTSIIAPPTVATSPGAKSRTASPQPVPAAIEHARLAQRSVGNQAMLRARSASPPAPPRAPVGALQRKCACGTSGSGTCAECKTKEAVQRRADGPQVAAIPPSVSQVLQRPGLPLDPVTRGFMESRFHRDFSGVRVHTDAEAARSARDLHACAYTVGNQIVFGAGRYAPAAADGRHLLAHELAHTIQQRGLQARFDAPLDVTSAGQVLERQADQAADAALRGDAVPAIEASARPVIAREEDLATTDPPPSQPAATTPPSTIAGGGPGATTITPVPPSTPPSPTPATGGPHCIWRMTGATRELYCEVPQFVVPVEKGALALPMYELAAAAGALRATVQVAPDRSVRNDFAQGRARTSSLRGSWLRKVHWPTGAQADARWRALFGIAPAAANPQNAFPLVNGAACDMDHVLELQLGGTNATNNVQVLDELPNTSSGSQIQHYLSNMATQAMALVPAGNAPASETPGPPARPDFITLKFNDARYAGTPAPCPVSPTLATTCMEAECLASASAPGGLAAPGVVDDGDPIDLRAGVAATSIRALAAPDVTVLTTPRRRTARDLVPGMMLTELRRGPGNADTVNGRLVQGHLPGDTQLPGHTNETLVPIELFPESLNHVFDFDVDGTTRRLRMRGRHPEVAFRYPYLSEAHIDVRQEADGTFAGTGTLRPSLPLLDRIQLGLDYDARSLRVSLGVPPDRLRTPIPRFRFTRAELRAQLLPEFHPEGVLEFAVGPNGRPPIATGALRVTGDSTGLVLDGTIDAHLPRVDQAHGRIAYRDGRWTTDLTIRSTQIGIPGIQSGELNVHLTEDGITADGTVTAALPGGHIVTFRVERTPAGELVYIGDANLHVPGLHPVVAHIRYDCDEFRGTARTGVDLGPLTGDVELRYRANTDTGRSSLEGDGTLAIRRGRVNGTFAAHVRDGVFTGEGRVQVRITDNLSGQVGISLDQHRLLRVSGELVVPNPIQIFPRVPQGGGHKEFLNRNLDIPIIGIPLGPLGAVGLIARITGAFGVNYHFGPGALENIRVAVAFNPLEADTAFTADGHAELNIPAYAGAYLRLRGSIGLSAAIASLTGGIEATAELGLEGGLRNRIDLHYTPDGFSVDATARISAHPVFRLDLAANVIAEIGALGLTQEWRKDWQLYHYEVGAGWEMGLEAGIGYSTRGGVRLPSLDQIRWIYPRDINVTAILQDMFRRATR